MPRKKGLAAQDKSTYVPYVKRQQIEDKNGWIHIVDSPRRSAKVTTIASPEERWQHTGDFELNGVSYIHRTLEEMASEFQYHKTKWLDSPACESLIILCKKKALESRVVSNIVSFGLGSLQNARREGRRTAHTQLAALQTIIENLDLEPLPCIFQDPQFTEMDAQFLSHLGYSVAQDPDAFGMILENSLIYTIHCYAEVYKGISLAGASAILIGTDVGIFNSPAAVLENIINDYEDDEFPQIRHDFSDTKVYWRKALKP